MKNNRRVFEVITRRCFLAKVAVLTGSVAFGVATHKSDEDWLIAAIEATKLGIKFELSDYPNDFRTYRQGNLNLIVYESNDFRDRWMKAHRHCVIEQPRDKKRRVRIFRHYLYGEPL